MHTCHVVKLLESGLVAAMPPFPSHCLSVEELFLVLVQSGVSVPYPDSASTARTKHIGG